VDAMDGGTIILMVRTGGKIPSLAIVDLVP